jgi:hypothetical protein
MNKIQAIGTTLRYKEAYFRFELFYEKMFQLEKFEKVKKLEPSRKKYFIAYAEHMTRKGYSAKTIRVELAAIRYFHELSEAKFSLPSNAELEKQGIIPILPSLEIPKRRRK